MVPILEPVIVLNWLPGLICKTILDAERDYRQYRAGVADDGDLPAYVPAAVSDYFDNLFSRKADWETGGDYFSTAVDFSIIFIILEQLSKKVPPSGYEFTNLIQALVDDLETSHAPSAKAETNVERYKALMNVDNRSVSDAPNDVIGLRKAFAVAENREAELLTSAYTTSGEKANATPESRQERVIVSTQTKG